MASKKSNGSRSNRNETSKDQRLRKGLATMLHILYWVILVGTFLLDFQENKEITEPEEILSGTWEEVTEEMTD